MLGGRTEKVVMYTTNDRVGSATGQMVKANLAAIGRDVEVKEYSFAVLIDKAGNRGEPFDMWSIGWFADYPDPYDFINILLDGRTIGPKNNINLERVLQQARVQQEDGPRPPSFTATRGTGRYGTLDIDITRNQSPLVITNNQNVREFISSRVGCATYSYAWGGLNLVLLCPKR